MVLKFLSTTCYVNNSSALTNQSENCTSAQNPYVINSEAHEVERKINVVFFLSGTYYVP